MQAVRSPLGWFKRQLAALCTRRALTVLGVCVASGVLLRLSFPVPGWVPLAWVALVPWLVVVRAGSGREAILGSVAMGLVAAGLGVSWQFLVTVVGGSLLAIYIGAYFVLFAWLVRMMMHRWRAPFVVAVPVVWVGCEYLRSWFLTGIPWLFVGHTQVPFTRLVQVCDLLGAYALSFLVVACNAALAEAVVAWRQRPRPWARLAAGGALVAVLVGATLAYGSWRLGHIATREGPRVGIVQANIPQDIKNKQTVESIARIFLEHRDTTLRLAPQLSSHRLDLVVWPETMIQLSLNRGEFAAIAQFRERLVELATVLRCPVLVGSYAEIGDDRKILADADGVVQTITDGEILVGERVYLLPHYTDPATNETPIRRIRVREGQTVRQGDTLVEYESVVHNSAYLVRPTGGMGLADRYDKTHLVPFGEYVPLKDLLWFLLPVVPYAKGFTPGDRLNLMELGDLRFGTLICFEDVFPRLVRRFVVRPNGRGADFLINISNDGWFQGSHELDQHLAMCRLRAVEFRTGIVRCCNTGISAIIGPDGSLHAMVRDDQGNYKNVGGVSTGRVRLRTETTFYARHGDILGVTCLGFALLPLLIGLLARIRSRLRRSRCADGTCPVG